MTDRGAPDNCGTPGLGCAEPKTSAPATVSITVNPVNSQPVATDLQVLSNEDTPVGITLSGSDVETPAANLIFTVTSSPTHGKLTGVPPNPTYTPDPNYYGSDSFKYTVTDRGDPNNCGTPSVNCAGPKTSDVATVSITISPVNDPPEIKSVNPETQTVQYSDRIAPITISATDVDSTNLTATATGLPSGLVLGSKNCSTFTIYEAIVGVSCTWKIEGTVVAPAGTYNVSIAVSDGIATVNKGTTLTLEPEGADAECSHGNPVAVKVAKPGGKSGLFSLIAFASETIPDVPEELASSGDISLAQVSMTLQPVGIGSPQTGTYTWVHNGTGYDAFLKATCNFNNVPVNTYSVQFVANGGYYDGYGEDVLVVYDPSLGYTSGGGSFYWPGTKDEETNYPGDRTNFGFTMTYTRKGTNVKGALLLIRYLPDGSIYRIKSNALYGLALGVSTATNGGYGWASFSGKATYLEPDSSDAIGNHEFIVYVEDRNDPGSGIDRFWVELRDQGRNVIPEMSMAREAASHAVELLSGNLFVPHGTK